MIDPVVCVARHVVCVARHVGCVARHVGCVARHVGCVARHVGCVARHVTCMTHCEFKGFLMYHLLFHFHYQKKKCSSSILISPCTVCNPCQEVASSLLSVRQSGRMANIDTRWL